ncbi:transcription initiation factor IIE subunit beta [Macrolepiota fuliginosa MF-IS2]|uniref:Transcription initiation factor IIE subunit beta n=1 Tax=Macrolepiota fuliginosa MF-IS2 TaxID=1400762 RepID=A0A9P5WVZ6_9AGAR|nr:transcription initiation factor IIE subunit beta [Macrolepiota fuliginosa MF-IS2]
MSKLAVDAAAFKATLHKQSYSFWHSQPAPETSAKLTTGNLYSTQEETAQMQYVIYSQPADTGVGTNVNTQLIYAVNHLKSMHNPMCLQDIAIVTNTPINTDTFLLKKFCSHNKVQYDPKTDLYFYKHKFSFHNKAALTEIQCQICKGGGISIHALKKSWKEAPQAIEELEKKDEVLIMCTVKDSQLCMVFWNEIKLDEEGGGRLVEKEFNELWHSLKVLNDVDLLKQLANEGLQVTNAEMLMPKALGTKKKGKKGGAP